LYKGNFFILFILILIFSSDIFSSDIFLQQHKYRDIFIIF